MKSVLEEIYEGKRGNFESIKESEKYKKDIKEYGEALERFSKELTEEQQKTLSEIFTMACGLEEEYGIVNFKEGFKLGMLVAMEVLE